MWAQILPGLRIKIFMTILLGVVYPLAITGICQVVFPHQANGSLTSADGRIVGSELLGQNFTRPGYFQPRPSAAGNDGFDATSSGGTNFGPTNQKLVDRVRTSIEKFRKDNPDYTGPIPADLLTTSASGLDPHISPASAMAQAPRVAKARGMPRERLEQLIARFTEHPDLGFIGESRVNVLKLNLALDGAGQ
jgi:potassium-transporting ATPase KdpC subunit